MLGVKEIKRKKRQKKWTRGKKKEGREEEKK